MASAPELSPIPDPRTQAGPARRALHLVIAGAVWALFAWSWILVLGRTSGSEIAFTTAFLSCSLVVIMIATSLWVSHNVSLFRHRPPRLLVRERVQSVESDKLGRSLALVGGHQGLQESPLVRITVEDERKVYRSAEVWQRAVTPPAVVEREAA